MRFTSSYIIYVPWNRTSQNYQMYKSKLILRRVLLFNFIVLSVYTGAGAAKNRQLRPRLLEDENNEKSYENCTSLLLFKFNRYLFVFLKLLMKRDQKRSQINMLNLNLKKNKNTTNINIIIYNSFILCLKYVVACIWF